MQIIFVLVAFMLLFTASIYIYNYMEPTCDITYVYSKCYKEAREPITLPEFRL